MVGRRKWKLCRIFPAFACHTLNSNTHIRAKLISMANAQLEYDFFFVILGGGCSTSISAASVKMRLHCDTVLVVAVVG